MLSARLCTVSLMIFWNMWMMKIRNKTNENWKPDLCVFYTLFLYHNPSGITYPFFAGGSCLLFFYFLKKSAPTAANMLHGDWTGRKYSLFITVCLLLLGFSVCFTDSLPLQPAVYKTLASAGSAFLYLCLHLSDDRLQCLPDDPLYFCLRPDLPAGICPVDIVRHDSGIDRFSDSDLPKSVSVCKIYPCCDRSFLPASDLFETRCRNCQINLTQGYHPKLQFLQMGSLPGLSESTPVIFIPVSSPRLLQ